MQNGDSGEQTGRGSSGYKTKQLTASTRSGPCSLAAQLQSHVSRYPMHNTDEFGRAQSSTCRLQLGVGVELAESGQGKVCALHNHRPANCALTGEQEQSPRNV